ncbi:discoidin domain-containing protein [Solirubrobacter phytolaccae]|uniref:Discoidin domain-containing protein n=1 Tax=Solirubrobacter phytolaccae TaxID=1404360 RepID=A0A9X3N656_9ACTN|nr:discoidin domain-containing protein [Solirubrobacter phytolaccae]MDA0179032.1 discoidin domain-containing protein [Solirubrobacter phytolaccae]
MRRIVGFTALSLAVAALSGTAVGVPGAEDDQVQFTPSVERLEILRCIGFEQLRVSLHNTTADHQYGDLFLKPTGPLQPSRTQWSSYTPVGQDVAMPIRVRVAPDAPVGDYELGYQLGATVQASTPVKVVSDPATQCVPHARMTATATSLQGSDDASKAVDGDPATIWRSAAGSLPQSITLDLGGVYDITELRYQPRFDGLLNGHINGYTLAVSTNGTTFTDVRTSTWGASELMKSAKLTTPARGVRKLRLTITAGRNNFASAAELIPIGVPVDVPAVTASALTVPNDLFAGKPVTATVTAGNWTNDPLPVDVTVGAPAGWTVQPVRVTIAPGTTQTVNVPVTPPAMPFPEPGLQPEVILTGRATPATGGGKVEGAPTATVWVKPDAPLFAQARDFGTPSSVVIIGGWTRISPSDVWTEGATAGWSGGVRPTGRDRGAGSDALRRDHVYATGEATLRLAVPPGKHRVALLRGDVTAATGSLIVKAEGKTLVGPGAALKAREFAWERFVLDGGAGGRTVDLTLSGDAGAEWKLAALVLDRSVQEDGGAGGTVPATLSLELGAPATFGTFVPGREAIYDTSTTATVISTAGDATLTASGPVHLRNGAFSLANPLQVTLSKAAWNAPVSNDEVTVGFRQQIGATESLRSGTYSGTVTLTLATTNP